ncbi:DUF6907 domain-containing protein [Streptomyces sp. UH6]|uniref:DUF6907 domain-containing protein n=1 Tax=Streptomyces sp. UH6 TaxID=2748379 RepID=UPI0015D4B265|nr:hypothetical protein [Streptomyces sp. UH6]NYV73138.1 hypothetical protein [Streptomyces sp. UH6]
MDTPQSSAALPASVQADQRFVPALINGVAVQLADPAWCRVDHIAANPRYIEDVSHSSDPVRLDLAAGATPLTLIEARLSADPASDRLASVYVEESATGKDWYLDAAAADAFADQLDAFAANFRAMAAQLRGDV